MVSVKATTKPKSGPPRRGVTNAAPARTRAGTKPAPVRAGARSPAAAARLAPATPPRHAGVGDDAVRRATGRGWAEWFVVLDKAGAADLAHSDIARLLRGRHGLTMWWSQMLTVGFEQARGRRVRHQTAKGFAVSVSRTMAAPANALFRAWTVPVVRRRWLGAARLEVTRATPDRTLRALWQGAATRLEIGFSAKGEGRTQVVVQQSGLPDAAAASRAKVFWAERLARLKELSEG